jgi:mannose-6-phosphate isomerase-like protein (cupin superfamily)
MPETITDLPGRRLEILLAEPDLTVTWTRHGPGQEGTDPHVHDRHTDAFLVLEGELTVPLHAGSLVVPAGHFVAVPAGVVHAFVNRFAGTTAFLNIHAPDGGFADFLRHGAAWDARDAPADGGRPPAGVAPQPDGAAVLERLHGVRLVHAGEAGAEVARG